ncbi:hypothetical protein Taro_026093 [Colocasia esculenta]|uniref:BTB domain-containing protein n=1 Tax=Colocasia esculenta TaxID=4460 RepID=A0A843VQ84_COLES|nr:hypothetical protein [Colocasia esculenta]
MRGRDRSEDGLSEIDRLGSTNSNVCWVLRHDGVARRVAAEDGTQGSPRAICVAAWAGVAQPTRITCALSAPHSSPPLQSASFLPSDAVRTTSGGVGDTLHNQRICVPASLMERPKVYSIAVPPSNIGEHFGQLLDSGKAADVNFEVNGEIFPAHKLVLAMRSPVFKAQFFGPMKDHKIRCIKVEDVEAPVFKVPSSS